MPTGWSRHWRKEVALSDLPGNFWVKWPELKWFYFLGGHVLEIEWYWQIIVFVVFCSCRWFQLRGYGLWCLASVRTVVLPMSKTNWQDSSIIHSPFPGNGNIRWSPSYLRMSRVDSSASSCKLKRIIETLAFQAFEVEDRHVTGVGFMKGIVGCFLMDLDLKWKLSSLTLVSLYTHVSQEATRVEPCSWNSDNNDLPELAQPEEDEIQGHLVWVWISWGRKRVMTGGRIASSNMFLHIWHLIYYFDVDVLRSSGHSSVCYCVIQARGESRVKSSDQTNSAMQFKEYNLAIFSHNYTNNASMMFTCA